MKIKSSQTTAVAVSCMYVWVYYAHFGVHAFQCGCCCELKSFSCVVQKYFAHIHIHIYRRSCRIQLTNGLSSHCLLWILRHIDFDN